MKIVIIADCYGQGYDFIEGDETNIKKDIAKTLIDFGYAIPVGKSGNNQDESPQDNDDNLDNEEPGTDDPTEEEKE